MGSDLEPHPPDAELESLEILGGVRDLQKFCCVLALKNCPGLDWAEFGVSRGIGATHFLEHLPETNRLYLFDSWEGLPEDWENHKEGQYRSPVPDFKDGRAHLIKGLFSDTIPGWVKTQKEPLGFLHMDADLYSSTILALDYLNPLIVRGTIILFDEYYNYAGWRDHEHKAFMEFIDKHNRKFRYIGKNDKHAAFPERNDQKTSKFVRVAVEILV
ncbi:MAG: class I SAM-dependent methyltransferase [Candidatus Omnitrophica bacterium]|nr:class I SAM-dependent methyltransferase [Candidatus Omnitrophota bacterium]